MENNRRTKIERNICAMINFGATFGFFFIPANNQISNLLNIKQNFIFTAFGTVSAPEWGT